MCSSAVPIIFPYQSIDGHNCCDGGLVLNLDIKDVISCCKGLGFDETDIIIDAIMPQNKTSINMDISKHNSYQMLIRAKDIFKYNADW